MAKVKVNKVVSLFVLAALLFSALTYAARPDPVFSDGSTQKQQGVEAEISCDGIGEDECLMRRTLVAHTDYIYTQNKNP